MYTYKRNKKILIKYKKNCLMSDPSFRLFTYLENFNRPETFMKFRRQRTPDFKPECKWIAEFLARLKKSTKFSPKLRCSFFRRCPRLYMMWSGAVNRQPGDRARNLQRRGYRAPPPRSKIFSGASRHHERKFSPDAYIYIRIKKKKKKIFFHDPTYYLTFDLPRELQSTWDFQ